MVMVLISRFLSLLVVHRTTRPKHLLCLRDGHSGISNSWLSLKPVQPCFAPYLNIAISRFYRLRNLSGIFYIWECPYST